MSFSIYSSIVGVLHINEELNHSVARILKKNEY